MSTLVQSAVRGLALFLGTFAVVNVVGGLVSPGFDANVWWIDVRDVAAPVADAALAATGVLSAWWAIVPDAGRRRRTATRVALWTSAGVAAWNAASAWTLAADGRIAMFPVPFSACVVAALLVIDAAVRRRAAPPRPAWTVVPSAAGWAVAFALLQMLCFGRTDYARPADAIVVFGARAYADGRPSVALADRVRTGCALWRRGLAPLLVLSGGPGDGSFHETDVMRTMALDEGVPESAIVVDREGTSTRATVEDVAAIAHERRLATVLAVSHAYHLPRVKMAFDRVGLAAFTVSAKESRSFAKMPWLVVREVAALWTYWIDGRRA